jgi:hypothetical protein
MSQIGMGVMDPMMVAMVSGFAQATIEAQASSVSQAQLHYTRCGHIITQAGTRYALQ